MWSSGKNIKFQSSSPCLFCCTCFIKLFSGSWATYIYKTKTSEQNAFVLKYVLVFIDFLPTAKKMNEFSKTAQSKFIKAPKKEKMIATLGNAQGCRVWLTVNPFQGHVLETQGRLAQIGTNCSSFNNNRRCTDESCDFSLLHLSAVWRTSFPSMLSGSWGYESFPEKRESPSLTGCAGPHTSAHTPPQWAPWSLRPSLPSLACPCGLPWLTDNKRHKNPPPRPPPANSTLG